MPSESAVRVQAQTDPSMIEFYRTRDDFARAYKPATDEERMLLTQMVQAWIHLQSIYRFRTEALQRRSLNDLFDNDIERYKLLNRTLNDAERMWRNAIQEFRRAQRRSGSANTRDTRSPRPRRAPDPDIGADGTARRSAHCELGPNSQAHPVAAITAKGERHVGHYGSERTGASIGRLWAIENTPAKHGFTHFRQRR